MPQHPMFVPTCIGEKDVLLTSRRHNVEYSPAAHATALAVRVWRPIVPKAVGLLVNDHNTVEPQTRPLQRDPKAFHRILDRSSQLLTLGMI